MKYEIYKLVDGKWALISRHRKYRAAKSHFDSYVRQGGASYELRPVR
jgi:hypothetical protein